MLPPVSDGIFAPDRIGHRLANIRRAGNHPAMRIAPRIIESSFQLPHHVLPQDMLDLFRIIVDMIHRDLRGVGEVQFPEAVIAHDGQRPLQSFRGEIKRVRIFAQAGQAVRAQFPRLGQRVLESLPPPLRQFSFFSER